MSFIKVKYRYPKEVKAELSASDESKNLNGEVCIYTVSVDNGAAGVYLKREQVYKIKTRVYGSYKKAFHVLAERIKKTEFPDAVVRNWNYFGRSGESVQSIVLEEVLFFPTRKETLKPSQEIGACACTTSSVNNL